MLRLTSSYAAWKWGQEGVAEGKKSGIRSLVRLPVSLKSSPKVLPRRPESGTLESELSSSLVKELSTLES